ncbi:MAG: response regulator [Desulfobacterales bacterium]|nr:response regulator [Desulfobacterales bacterium]
MIGVQDRHHRVIRYNKAGYDFLGLTPAEVAGRTCHELIGHAIPCATCATSEVYRTNRVARVEKFVPEIGRWLDVRAYPILDENGEWTQVIEHLRDITREKTAEAELTAAHERLTTILDSIEAHIFVADIATHRILFINRKMREDFNRDLVGSLCYEAFRCESAPCADCSNEQLIGADGEPTGIHSWEGQNPVTGRWYLNYDRAIRWVDGRMVRLQIATDITRAKESEQERARMEVQLQQSQKFEAIGTLAGGVAHDFNNLLMGIQGRASLMRVDLPPSHPHREHLRAIEDYIRSAADLTRQLLGFARGGKYEVKPLDLNELVLTTASMFGRTKKEIRIHTRLPETPLVVEADRSQIEQVLLNIYVNAWQAMPDGGELYIGAKTLVLDEALCRPHQAVPGRYHSVAITDTGIGMDAATQLRIFDPFFTTKEKGRGTGLGLASAYGIVKNHGGMITVESQKRQGATFTIYLPASDREALAESSPESRLMRGSETILLVDDEEMILEVGRSMLERLGYKVHCAKNGSEALDLLKRQRDGIDLVILDLIMPGMDGGKLFDRIRELRPGLSALLSSGYAIDGQAEEILHRGCNGFIQKPFGITELSTKLRSILDP